MTTGVCKITLRCERRRRKGPWKSPEFEARWCRACLEHLHGQGMVVGRSRWRACLRSIIIPWHWGWPARRGGSLLAERRIFWLLPTIIPCPWRCSRHARHHRASNSGDFHGPLRCLRSHRKVILYTPVVVHPHRIRCQLWPRPMCSVHAWDSVEHADPLK